MTERLYKLLNEDGTTPQVYGRWLLPDIEGEPGPWMPEVTGKLVPCRNGYHVLRLKDLLEWSGPVLWEVETGTEIVPSDTKCVVRTARLLRRCPEWNLATLRLFACDCAGRVLPIFERRFPDDDRPRRAIAVARQFAQGEATERDLAAAWAAAEAAARAAAEAAAGAAAGAAAWAAAEAAAWAAAEDAAWAAAGAAAEAAAEAAARADERDWQIQHLAELLGLE